jgi:hypothetical protein
MFETTNQSSSGKPTKNYGKLPLFMGKSTISMGAVEFLVFRGAIFLEAEILEAEQGQPGPRSSSRPLLVSDLPSGYVNIAIENDHL